MRYSLGLKIGLLLSAFGILASGLTGYYSYQESRTMLVKAAEQELMTSTQVLGRRFLIMLSEGAENVRLLARLRATLLSLTTTSDALRNQDLNQLARIFSDLMELHPEYTQVRLIDAKHFGREKVRIDRDEGELSRVLGQNLLEKAQYPYVYETLRLQPGEIFLSKISINREYGTHQAWRKPSLQLATPVAGYDGKVRGLIVINIDLAEIFSVLKADLPADLQLYLTNQEGDFLIHPDSSQEFGFDRGRRILVQDSFPVTATLFDSKPDQHERDQRVFHVDSRQTALVEDRRGENGALPVAAAFMKLDLGSLAPQRFLVLGLSIPLSVIYQDSLSLARAVFNITLALSLLAVVLSLLVSRRLSQPMHQMVNAVKRFTGERHMGELPTERQDEIGLLARSFSEMQNQLQDYLEDLRQKEMHLHHLAQHDSLTNLPNRMLLYDRLNHAIHKAERNARMVAVIFIDLDHFKHINDSLGHAVGDDVIKTIARSLSGLVREEDTVARLGGDEFIVILESIDDACQVGVIAQKLLDQLSQPVRHRERALYLSASIGISFYPQDGQNAETLVRNADSAMYRAKEQGRNNFHFYTEDMTLQALQRVQLESEMRQALAQGDFRLHFQPQISLETGEVVGVEALVRWQKDPETLLMPGSFIRLAEDTGLIEPLGEWVLDAACRQMVSWREAGLNPGRVAVNLSIRQLRRRELFENLMNTLARTHCRPEWLELEVTESLFMESSQEAVATLERVRNQGVELAIDDFGTGYSSLSYLKNLPITKLKIDRTFIHNIPSDPNNMAITRAIIAMAQSLNLRVIAEGVESEMQREFLRLEGCQEGQGYYFSKPVTAEEIPNVLAAVRTNPVA